MLSGSVRCLTQRHVHEFVSESQGAARLAAGQSASPGRRRYGGPGQVALNRRPDGGHYVISRHRGQRLEAQDVPAQAQAEQLRGDERAALGRALIAKAAIGSVTSWPSTV